MSKIFSFLLIIGSFAFLLSCQSNSYPEYIRPDFTNSEILTNEIVLLRKEKESNSVSALWKANLLYNETNSDKVQMLYQECVETVLKQYYDSIESKEWDVAIRLAKSLLVVNNSAADAIRVMLDESFERSILQSQEELEKLPHLQQPGEKFDSNTNSSIPTFITGVVTVWVDLGVKIERGIGYPNVSLGSGFFIDDRGYIITNHHVISELVDPEYEGYSKLYIKLSSDSETRIPAKVIGWDKTLDLALLKTEITPPYVYTLGTSLGLNIGTQIYAIGSPLGLENTITSGIISAFDRQLLSTASVMQIDAAINSGNSGGPLINANGEVQGIVFAGVQSYQGLNFAIPVEYLNAILLRLYSEGEVTHSWIGASGRTIKKYPSDEFGLGVEILYVMPGSSAFKAGVERGTIISAINGKSVSSLEELQFALINLPPESVVTLETMADKESQKEYRTVYLEKRPEQPGLEIYEREPSYRMVYPIFGMELIPASVGNKNQFTVQSIIKGSIADESGFSVHDPVEIRKTVLSENKDAVFIETFTKKRKSGYFEVNVSIGSALDSLYLF